MWLFSWDSLNDDFKKCSRYKNAVYFSIKQGKRSGYEHSLLQLRAPGFISFKNTHIRNYIFSFSARNQGVHSEPWVLCDLNQYKPKKKNRKKCQLTNFLFFLVKMPEGEVVEKKRGRQPAAAKEDKVRLSTPN